MDNTLRVEFYDKFHCIADRCSFTCCVGWDIHIDTNTYDKWKNNEKIGTSDSKVKIKKSGKETKYFIKMGPQKCCPFLDSKGLCKVVLTSGEEYLPKICDRFPRTENNYDELMELSLSCSCPAVIDIMNNLSDKMKYLFEGDKSMVDRLPSEYKIREAMITIIQNDTFSFKDRILLIFQMLIAMKKEYVITKDMISKYQEEDELLSLSRLWEGVTYEAEDSLFETNELFLDIVCNYRSEKHYKSYLNDIAGFAESFVITKNKAISEKLRTKWNEFLPFFKQYEQLIENCLVSKIFSNCICDDLDDMIMQYQIIITEFVMIRYSAFLYQMMKENNDSKYSGQQYNRSKELDYDKIKDFIVIYSRIIENNADGMREFWEESFDGAEWDFGYLLLLMN